MRKIGPELSDSLFLGPSRVNTEFSFAVRMRSASNTLATVTHRLLAMLRDCQADIILVEFIVPGEKDVFKRSRHVDEHSALDAA